MLASAEAERLLLCCSLAAVERESLSEADSLACLWETLTDASWLAASERLALSCSSCSEFTFDTDWLVAADSAVDCAAEALMLVLAEVDIDADWTLLSDAAREALSDWAVLAEADSYAWLSTVLLDWLMEFAS